jgi:TRAP-type C4-dicarboxylate transport system substrate-binding protein
MSKRMPFSFTLMILCFLMAGQATGETIIKLGMLATKESDWGIIFQRMNEELREKSQGQLQFRFFWGRDEEQLIRRTEMGQCDAVSLTATGLGQILEEFLIFQLPMLFSTYEELDHIRRELTAEFSKRLEGKGYVFLGWGDLGFIRLLSKTPIRTQDDLQKTRFWAWDIDPIGQAFASASGREPIVLPIQSVKSSLEEDYIQTVYASPLACIMFQWHTQVEYISDLRLAAGIGATIISKRQYDKLSGKHKDLLREIAEKYHQQLVETIREENKKSISTLEGQGIEVIDVPQQEREKWREVARQVRERFVGDLYEEELLDKVRRLLDEYNTKR